MQQRPLAMASLHADRYHLDLDPATRAPHLLRGWCRTLAYVALAASAWPAMAQVQATVKTDGDWRYALGAGGSAARGNTSSTSVNLSGEAVRATAGSKFDVAARGLYTKSSGATTAQNAALTGQYNLDFTPLYFSFAKLDALRDDPANISLRYSAFAGAGRHVFKTDANTLDVSLGLGYTQDKYLTPTLISNDLVTRYGRAEGLLAEESTHKLTGTTSLRQKFTYFPNLQRSGDARAVFDAGLSVSMTPTLALTAGITYRYDTNPGVGLVKGDTLFVTGIQVKLD
jgi:putative salt-induced outer membrane protein